VATAEQALVFLGADKDTADEFIIPLYAAKVSSILNPIFFLRPQLYITMIVYIHNQYR
jgi:hypothetical protein